MKGLCFYILFPIVSKVLENNEYICAIVENVKKCS